MATLALESVSPTRTTFGVDPQASDGELILQVARGDAEIGFQQMSELRPITGIEIVGPLPSAVQRVSVFSAGVVSRSTHASLAREFIQFLTSPAARPIVAATGLEPLP